LFWYEQRRSACAWNELELAGLAQLAHKAPTAVQHGRDL
jgi:hypothetical protein